jgi:hypothetical protein
MKTPESGLAETAQECFVFVTAVFAKREIYSVGQKTTLVKENYLSGSTLLHYLPE